MSKKWKGPVRERTNSRYEGSPKEHEAQKQRQRDWYQANKVEARRKANERVLIRREINQQYLVNFLSGEKCADCGCGDIRLLTFDHKNPDEKHGNIADIVSRGYDIKHLKTEILKCEVTCHNCHMLRTFTQLGGSYRERMLPIPKEEMDKMIVDHYGNRED
jgi:hypothetical protein